LLLFQLADWLALLIYARQKSHRSGDAGPVVGVGRAAHFSFVVRVLSRDRKRLPINTNDEIARIVEPSLEAMGYRLVRVMLSGAKHPTLQLMAERRDDAAMSVEDCAEISRQVSALLDVADPIADAYTLEVSSPGIDRPLVRPEDFDRFAGFVAQVELTQPQDGKRRFRGRLLGRVDAEIRLAGAGGGGEIRLPFAAIAKAKLVLTDDLLALAQQRQPAQTN
jgi:ribosome maturation factor RimP